jgi:parafibromin
MAEHDPLVLLRQSISASKPFAPAASSDPSAPTVELAQATHLAFPDHGVALPIDASTRFVSNDKAVDLRSIYFAWLNRERPIPEYNAAATALNDSLAGAGKVHNLGFIEKLDLITWLEGASEESEYIKPLAGEKDAAAAAAEGGAAGVAAAKTGAAATAAQARTGKGTMDPRLASVYDGERRMGDRNTVLRGIKPTVSSSLLSPVTLNGEIRFTDSMFFCPGLLSCAKTRGSLPIAKTTTRLRRHRSGLP